jgi:hypothetical protein
MATIMQEQEAAIALRYSFELPEGLVANLRAIIGEHGTNFGDLLDIVLAGRAGPEKPAEGGTNDLTVELREGGTGQPCYLHLDANPKVYTPDSLAILGAGLVRLLEQVCVDPSAQRAQLLSGFKSLAMAMAMAMAAATATATAMASAAGFARRTSRRCVRSRPNTARD